MSRPLKNIALLLAASLVGLLLLEGLLRLHNPLRSTVESDRIVLPANSIYEIKNTSKRGLARNIRVTTNSIGFRGPEPTPEFEDDLTIITVGGSTTHSQFQSDGADWPALLATRLASRIAHLWVNNAGLDGHSTFGHEILLVDYLARLRPDLVLFLIGMNEVGRKLPTDHDRENVANGLHLVNFEQLVKSASNYSEIMATTLNLYRASRAAVLGLAHQDVRLASLPHSGTNLPQMQLELARHRAQYLTGFEERLQSLLYQTYRAEITPVLITQPMLVGKGTDPTTGVNLESVQVHMFGMTTSGRAIWETLELYNGVTREVARETGTFLIDLARLLPKDSRFFYDYGHFTDKGAEAVAAIVARKLCPFVADRFPAYLERQCDSEN